MKKQFPPVVHLIWETPDHDEPFLRVCSRGVAEIDEPMLPIAVYQLVSVGHVEIKKRIVISKAKK